MTDHKDKHYGDNEAEARFQKLVKAALDTSPTPLKSMTLKGMPSQSKKRDRKAKAGKKPERGE